MTRRSDPPRRGRRLWTNPEGAPRRLLPVSSEQKGCRKENWAFRRGQSLIVSPCQSCDLIRRDAPPPGVLSSPQCKTNLLSPGWLSRRDADRDPRGRVPAVRLLRRPRPDLPSARPQGRRLRKPAPPGPRDHARHSLHPGAGRPPCSHAGGAGAVRRGRRRRRVHLPPPYPGRGVGPPRQGAPGVDDLPDRHARRRLAAGARRRALPRDGPRMNLFRPEYALSVGVAVALALLFPVTKHLRRDERKSYYTLQIITLLGAVLGAKLSVLVGDLDWPFVPLPDWHTILVSGRSVTGALILGFLAAEVAKP